MINTTEFNSLIFYQGDVNNYKVTCEAEENAYNSKFYKTKQAYNILNTLLYPGIENEITRICKEKKNVPIELLLSIEEILNVYENIFSLMCKYSLSRISGEKIYAFRKDRIQSMEIIDRGYSMSFSSCSLEDTCDEYFLKKDGILLLEFDISNNLPFVLLNDIIKNSCFEYEKEVLLPPFITFEKTPLKLTDKEMDYKDINGFPPKEKYLIKVNGIIFDDSNKSIDIDFNISSIEEISNGAKRAVEILCKLKAEKQISEEDKKFYINWKKILQAYVYKRFESIYKNLYIK